MFTKLPKSDVLPKIFVKMTQKVQILLDIFNKSTLPIILFSCLHAVVCGYKTDRGWVHAVVCGNKTGREIKNALCLNEILHGKPRGFPLVRGRVLYKQTLTGYYSRQQPSSLRLVDVIFLEMECVGVKRFLRFDVIFLEMECVGVKRFLRFSRRREHGSAQNFFSGFRRKT